MPTRCGEWNWNAHHDNENEKWKSELDNVFSIFDASEIFIIEQCKLGFKAKHQFWLKTKLHRKEHYT